jgi:hypothetical protein
VHSWNLRDFKPTVDNWVRSLDSTEPPYDSIPFNFENALKSHIYDEVAGFDYACIHIRELFRRSLNANSNVVQPFYESHWKDDLPLELAKFELIGIPSSTVENRGKSLTTQLFCLPVTPIVSPHPDKDDDHVFYGIVQAHLDSIKGMSGGPIVGFCEGESIPYLIAVQSGWNPSDKIIYGPWAKPLGLALEEHVRQVAH